MKQTKCQLNWNLEISCRLVKKEMSLDFNCWTKTGVWNIKSSQQIISPPLLHNNRKIESSRFFMVAEGSLTYIHINFTFSLCYTKGEHSKWEKKWPMTVPSIPDIGIEVLFWKDTKKENPISSETKNRISVALPFAHMVYKLWSSIWSSAERQIALLL